VSDCEAEFHTYAMEWTPDYIKGLIDGEVYFTYENPKLADPEENQLYWPYHKPFYLKLNMAIGGSWGGYMGIDTSIFPVSYVIDHVRVFQKQ
jgi:beta-glucanase (GH16 family)